MQLGRAHRLQAEARARHRAAKELWLAEQARKAEEAEIKASRDAREKAREQVASAAGGGGGW